MYRPAIYQKNESGYIFEFIQKHPFASFILKGKHLLATHIPILTKGHADEFVMFGHIANHNEQYKYLKDGTEALLIFQGAHAYISSSWYKEKDISTWDYSAVHANVRIRIQDEQTLKQSLEILVNYFEEQEQKPLFYKDIPVDLLLDHIPRITGFWCEPFKLEAIAKLHQGFEKEDITSVAKNLDTRKDVLSQELSKDIKREHGQGH